jgi:hypothetical protein
MQMLPWEFTHYMSANDELDEININVMEFAQAVILMITFIAWAGGRGCV